MKEGPPSSEGGLEMSNPERYLDDVVNNFVQRVNLDKQTLEKVLVFQFAPCGFFEGENIRGIIENFLQTEFPVEERMLVIFLNGSQSEEDTVSQVIESYRGENIVVLKHVWGDDAPVSMGMIRAIPVEFIRRSLEAKEVETNPLIVSNDADSIRFSKDYLLNLRNNIGANQMGGSVSRFELSGVNFLYDLNIVLGEIDRSIRSFGLEKEEDSFKRGHIYPGGSNMAFRLDDYPGYDLSKNKGEDTELFRRLESTGVQFKYLNTAKVYTHPRRIINGFNNGKYFHEVWKDWEKTGEVGREDGVLEEGSFSSGEVVSFLNQYLSNRLYYLYGLNYHKDDIPTFIKFANNYVKKVVKYLRIFLNSAGIDSANYYFRGIDFSNIPNTGGEDFIFGHKFITEE